MDIFVGRGDCGDYLSTLSEPVVFVRGIIYGRETLKSAKGFGTEIDLSVVEEESGQLRFKYDSSGAYELSDAAVVPKFAIMAKIMPSQISVTAAHIDDTTDDDALPDESDLSSIDLANISPASQGSPQRTIRVRVAPLSEAEVDRIERAKRTN